MPLNCPSSVVEGLNGEIGVVASVVRMMVQIDVVDGHWIRECERQCCATAHVDSSNGSPRQITIKRTLTSRSGTAPRTIRHGEVTRAFWALTIPRQKAWWSSKNLQLLNPSHPLRAQADLGSNHWCCKLESKNGFHRSVAANGEVSAVPLNCPSSVVE